MDALNVFPVPDCDTGTNMSQTINSAVKEMQAKNAVSVGDVAAAVARGALKGARGNSGVILSQILRGFASALDGAEDIDCALMIRALRAGADTAYKAVMKPKEGTILTVARVMAEDAERNCREMTDVVDLFRAILKSGEAILKKTPDMLPVLKQAGVVDSGGTGLTIIYRGMLAALTGEPVEVDVPTEGARAAMPGEFVDDHDSLEEITFGYCTEFIVSHPAPGDARQRRGAPSQASGEAGATACWSSPTSPWSRCMYTPTTPARRCNTRWNWANWTPSKIDNMFEEHRERMAKLAARKRRSRSPMASSAWRWAAASSTSSRN